LSALRRDIKAGVEEMEALSDIAMAAWMRKKEKMKARQSSKLEVAEQRKWGVGQKGNSGIRVKESKRGKCGPSVKDAVKMLNMEVEVEMLATKKAQAEVKTKARRKVKRRKLVLGHMIAGIKEDIDEDDTTFKKAKVKTKSRPKFQKRGKPTGTKTQKEYWQERQIKRNGRKLQQQQQ